MPDEDNHISSSDDDYNPELEVPLHPAKVVPVDVPIVSTTTTSESEKPSDLTTTDAITTTVTDSVNTTPRRVKTVTFDDNLIEISSDIIPSSSGEESGDDTGNNSQQEDKDDNDSIDEDVLQVIDDNDDNEYDPSTPNLPAKPHDAKDSTNKIQKTLLALDEKYSTINVPLFNEIVQYFITSTMFSDQHFNSLPPSEKESEVLTAFQNSTSKYVNPLQVNVNFYATTSYNKGNMKPNEESQLLVPINPYCRRPDITRPMTHEERYQFDEFRKEAEKHSKEFECLNFPGGSRLFVGNLAVNSLKISDVWRIFKMYGNVKAVNMKQGYGFVQYTEAEACTKAIQGEEHVPLHNRLMHLQVSKTHEKHIENGVKEVEKSKDRSRERERESDRERERSPQRIARERERSPVRPTQATNDKNTNNKVRVIISLESDAGFNHLLVNSLNEVGLDCGIKHVETNADEVPQETITESAYAGVCATIVTNKMEMVNLFLFERDSDDGAIKFDEYESIALESAVHFILEHMKKTASKNEDRSRNDRRKNNNTNFNNNANNNNNNRDRFNNNKDNRNRDRNKNGNNNNYNNRNDRKNNNNRNDRNDRNNRNNNQRNQSNNSYPRFSPKQPNEQNHIPRGPAGKYHSPNPSQSQQLQPQQQQQQPQQPLQQTQQPSQQQYNGYNGNNYNNQRAPPPQQQQQQQQQFGGYNSNNAQNNMAAQLLNQLASLDQNSLQNMLAMVTQQQQQQQRQNQGPPLPQFQNQGPPQQYQNQGPPQYQNQGPPQYQQRPGPPQYQPPPPQQQQHQGPPPQGVAGLYSQLQNMAPGSNVNNQPPPGNNSASPQNGDNNDDTSKLFETLARLKNNM